MMEFTKKYSQWVFKKINLDIIQETFTFLAPWNFRTREDLKFLASS